MLACASPAAAKATAAPDLHHASAEFSIGIRLGLPAAASTFSPSDVAPAGMQALGTTMTTRYWLSPGGPADASRRYRIALTEQGVDLAESLGDDGSWSARWRSGDGRCFEVRAQPVLGADALRLAERGVECGRPSNP